MEASARLAFPAVTLTIRASTIAALTRTDTLPLHLKSERLVKEERKRAMFLSSQKKRVEATRGVGGELYIHKKVGIVKIQKGMENQLQARVKGKGETKEDASQQLLGDSCMFVTMTKASLEIKGNLMGYDQSKVGEGLSVGERGSSKQERKEIDICLASRGRSTAMNPVLGTTVRFPFQSRQTHRVRTEAAAMLHL
jgi:hypothetical protein